MPSYPELLQPLSSGNVISAGLRLYRARFKDYAGIAARMLLWLSLSLVLFFVVVAVLFAIIRNEIAVVLICIPLFLVFWFYWMGRFLAGSAAIARFTFNHLNQQTEPAKASSSYTNPRSWGFALIGLMLSLIFGAVTMGLYLVLILIGGIIYAAVFASLSLGTGGGSAVLEAMQNPAWVVAIIFGILVLFLMFLVLWTWIYARFSIAEIPYATEAETGAVESIGRSWSLTAQSAWRVTLILCVVPVVLLPVNFWVQIISFIVQFGALGIFGSDNTAGILLGNLFSLAIGLSAFIMVTLPVWQAIKGVLYYDLRNRREGLGLSLSGAEGEVEDGVYDANEPRDSLQTQGLDGSRDRPSSLTSNPAADLWLPSLCHRITLVTPESVELEFTLAGIGSRALALAIDSLLILVANVLFWFFGSLLAMQLINSLTASGVSYDTVVIWLLAIGFLGSALISASYFVAFETLRQGQTPGKRYAQIRVIRDDGRPVGLTQSALRALLRLLDDILFLGATLVFFNKREKRLGDMVAGTLVIQEERLSAQSSAIAPTPEAKTLAVELPSLTDLTQLRPDDFAVIREYLQRRESMAAPARTDLSLKLARQARAIVHLETIPSGVTSDQFLEAIYWAYQKQA
ncbi:MAG: RDD family protein [Oculatellaceae cyanobacterium Prado106]|jgi:uncharacterized RDD family membrane protein YckC|nr:RDD family protein [Oculatellaceae cyanobacterium Prado106]